MAGGVYRVRRSERNMLCVGTIWVIGQAAVGWFAMFEVEAKGEVEASVEGWCDEVSVENELVAYLWPAVWVSVVLVLERLGKSVTGILMLLEPLKFRGRKEDLPEDETNKVWVRSRLLKSPNITVRYAHHVADNPTYVGFAQSGRSDSTTVVSGGVEA